MDESEDNMSSEDMLMNENPSLNMTKAKKRSLVERELETNLTARVTSPVTQFDTGCTSRYGRARRLKTDADYIDTDKGIKIMTSPVYVKTPAKVQSPVYKMHASNSPIKTEPKEETPLKVEVMDSSLDNQIENIYSKNMSLSRFGSDEKKNKSPGNKFPKVYVRKDLIQSREKEEYVMMIKNMFSPAKSSQKSNSHLNNILERSSEKYCLNSSIGNSKSHNSLLSNSSVVKTLDFDNKKKKKENRDGKAIPSKSDLFDLEAKCEYQVGDLTWARMGTFPFWPCIVTREPASGMFVKKKLFGRIERDIIHVTFFGDNGRRGWIVDTMLRRFLGQLEFEATREAFSPSEKKKDPRLYAAFFVSEKKMPQWNISVEEAETLLREPKRLRIDILYDMLAKTRSSKCTPKQQKSGKITRTASDVASDVSLSESLYDTLFSEDDGKSEDTERSRSKTRLSLDVSEVVTACLDNMAAKTGITKIQRQSHMDRWLQKAKSKTPEKLQANLPTQQKEIKVTSAKKKKKISPIRVPIQKPYSFRKSSYEPQILKSHDNEHDYSTKRSNDSSQTSDENVNANFAVGLKAKAESLSDKAKDVNYETKTDQNNKALKERRTDIALQENANNTIETGHIDITDEKIDEIEVNMCSVEENDELLLRHQGKPIEITYKVNHHTISQTVDKPTKDTEKPIETKQIAYKQSLDTDEQSGIVKILNNDSMDEKKVPHEHKKDVTESAEITDKTDKYSLRNKKTIEVDQKNCVSIDTEKLVQIAQKPDTHPIDTKKPDRNTRVTAIEGNILSDSKKDSAEFVKYLELRQDSLMDEHPELSQAEIEDYLYKTWQYEESSKSDLRKNDDSKHLGVVKGLKIKKKKCLSLKFNSKKSTKKQNEDRLPMISLLSGTSFSRSPNTRLSKSAATAIDTNERMSNVTKESSAVKAIKSVQIVTEHSYTEKHVETTENLDENNVDTLKLSTDNIKIEAPLIENATPVRRSLRAKLSKSPAIAMETNEIFNSVSKESISVKSILTMTENCNTEELPESKQNLVEACMNTPNLNIDTSLIEGSTTVRRSLRTKVPKSPAIAMQTNETMSIVSKETNSVEEIESTQIVSEHCNKITRQKVEEIEIISPKPSNYNEDKEIVDTSFIESSASIKRSLRTKSSIFPAIAMDTNDITSSINKENTSKTIETTPTLTEHCNTEKLSGITRNPDDKEKQETTLTVGSIRKSLRTKLSNSKAISQDTNEIMNSVSKDSILNRTESTQIIPGKRFTDTTQKPGEHEVDTSKQAENNTDKEELKAFVGDTFVRKSLRIKLSNSSAISLNTDETMKSVSKETSTAKTGGTQVLAENKSVTTPTLYEIKAPKQSEYNVDKEEKEIILIVGDTSGRKSYRTKLSNSSVVSMNNNGMLDSFSLERSTLKTKGSTKILTKNNSSIEKHSETTQKPDKHETDATNESEYNIKKEKIETTLKVGDTSVRRSLRTRLSNSLAMSMDTNEALNSVSKENITGKAIESTQREHCFSGKHPVMSQNLDENHMETPLKGDYDIKKEVEEHDTRGEKLTEITQEGNKPKIETNKHVNTIQLVDELSNTDTEKQGGTTLVNDKLFINAEKQMDIVKVKDEPKNDTEKPLDVIQHIVEYCIKTETQTDIQKADELNTTTKIPFGITALTYKSCIGTKKSEQNYVAKKSDRILARQKKLIKSNEITDSSCIDSKKATNVTQSFYSIDNKSQIPIIKHTYGHSSNLDNNNKHSEITQIATEPCIHVEKPDHIKLLVNEHPMKNDQTILDEDKEYGHLDFVFSCLNEKLLSTNNVNKSIIENNKNVSNNKIFSKDFEMAKSKNVINSDKKGPDNLNSNNNKPNLSNSNASPENHINEDANSFPSHEGTKIVNLDQCKYKKLYDSCTNLRVRVERLPSLSHKVINKKNLENEIMLSNAHQNEVINKIDPNNTNSKAVGRMLSEDLIVNGNNTATCIAHATDNEVRNVAITIDKENEVKINVHDESIKDIVNYKNLQNTEANIHNTNPTNVVDSNSCSSVNEKVVSCKMFHNIVSYDIPEWKKTDNNMVADMNKLAKKDLLLDENDIENNQDTVNIVPVAIVKSETECPEIKPNPLANAYEYIFDDDEDEFESPAFSPIFKEPIETIPDEKENNNDENNDMVAAIDKNAIDIIDNSLIKDASTESPLREELVISTENKNREDVKTKELNLDALNKEKNEKCVKDELMKSVSRLPDPVKINGFHLYEYGLDFSDNDVNAETLSINSEESEPLAVTKTKLFSKKRKDATKALQDIEFVKYKELRQDALMDEHPELNQDEIVDYLYKTWHYEENAKSDIVKSDDIEQASLVKGLNDNLRQKSIRNRYRENKKKNKKRDDDTLSICSNISVKRKIQDEDTLSINSDISDTSIRQRLRTKLSSSPAISLNENEFSVSKESSPERKPHIEDTMSADSDDSIKITKRKIRNQILDDSLDGEERFFVSKENTKSIDESIPKLTIKTEETRPRRNVEKKESKSPKSSYDSNIKKYFSAVNSDTENKTNRTDEQETLYVSRKIKEEYDPETVSITSVNSEDSEVSISKRKQRKNEKQTAKTMDDPEFLKYVELRQDVLIDENPQLTQDEIVSYLYKTWLYEESAKSDLKKSDDIEQANLVKGLNTEVQPKKVKKKIKVEKCPVDDEIALKDKPRRKISQPFYCEDIISDIEDEIELFEIFKTAKKSNAIKSEVGNEDVNKTNDFKSSDVKTEAEAILIQDEIDEVELYFSQLPLAKPNVFKGLVREKVCEICEKKGNLVKCKGCSGMFHVDCEIKVQEEGVVASTRGRKKKKKPGRKPKNFEDSGSHSDEKSQDVSEENNVSIEEIETEPRVVDEAVFEAALSAKMKELLPTIDLTYDSYSSDDGLDWNSAPPGHCEIVDVKLKPKTVIDYSDFKCKNCQMFPTPVCFVCKEAVSKTGVDHRQKCQTNHCNKYYHLECLDHWPQTQFNSGEPSKSNKKINGRFEAVMCPRHVCHTCVSDDPRGCKTRFSGDKLARCVKCPATYHSFTKCLPAGTQILTGSLIVCPRHYEQRSGKVPCHVNTGWCFICALGGSLICCEYCPTSFHAECLNIKPPEGGYMCEDCETGRLPLYGEMVWVKLGHYRWWPGIILHPSEIPENIMAVKHSPGEFVVRFFGQYDHYWVNRGRVFPFQEGDSGRISTQKSKIDAAFITAMEHAHRAFEILKKAQPNDEESQDIASSLLPPHYVKLKVNKPCGSLVGRRPDVEESSLTQCECDPKVEDPCGPYSHCLNRMLLTECGPICLAGDRCSNRAFEKRLYPKLAPYRTPHRGWGLKTLQDIRAGQFVIEYVGELLDEEEFRRRMNRMHEIRDENFYFLTLDKERMIDAGPKGNLARFMNHCCEPNCETQKWTVLGDVRVGLFAIYDIPANSELTFNYNLECTGIEKKRCMCGARRCSGYIGAKPKQDETQPKKKRAYKKRAKPIEESPSSIKNKPKRPVGRPAKPRELTEIEKDLLIIKNATNGLSSDSESSSRLSSIDNPNPKALKRKRVSFSTEESVCSSPSTKKGSEDSSPSTKKAKIEENSPSMKKSKSEDTLTITPSAKKLKIEEKSEVGD